MSRPAISIEHLDIRYGKKVAVKDVSLHVEEGDVYALLGRNGAGKSSLIRALLGQQLPTRGNIQIDGRDVWKQRTELMQTVGVVPEEPDAPPEMNVDQLISFCKPLYRRWDARSIDERLQRFGVPRRTPFSSLSKGQKGQVGLALALAFEPKILILDDPTLGLDVVARRSFFDELIGELADRGTTVFLTTHDLAAAEPLVSRVGIMKDGTLMLDEEVESLKQRFRRIRMHEKMEVASQLEPLRAVRVVSSAYGTEAEVANYDDEMFAQVRQQKKLEAEVGTMSLEEIFFAVAGEAKDRS